MSPKTPDDDGTKSQMRMLFYMIRDDIKGFEEYFTWEQFLEFCQSEFKHCPCCAQEVK